MTPTPIQAMVVVSGARDFIEATVTPEGSALGFVTAHLDVGPLPAKWDPNAFPGPPDVSYAPGLPKIEGWKLQSSGFACLPAQSVSQIRKETPGPISVPIYTYHGINQGLTETGPPSKREGLVVGIATQAHDLGQAGGGVLTPGNAVGAIGRMVVLGFPIYYMKDSEAYPIMRAAFAYVNASPTLPQHGP